MAKVPDTPEGRRIAELFSSHRSPVKAAAAWLGMDYSTLWRQLNGKTAMPKTTRIALFAGELLGTEVFDDV